MIARRARPTDKGAIARLVSGSRYAVVQVPDGVLEDASQGCEDHLFFVAERTQELGCVCGLRLSPDSVAQIRVLALDDDWQLQGALSVLLPALSGVLREHGIAQVVFIGADEWLLRGLGEAGFRRENVIVSLQKTDFAIPDGGSQEVTIRDARPGDLTQLVAIDALTFSPVWRNSRCTLQELLDSYPYFCVAELDGRVVGYQCAYLQGRHGHLTRIAVNPAFQRKRIGVRLLAEAIAFFQRSQALGITLNTQSDNERALRLYRWFGFQSLGVEAQVLTARIG